MGKAFVLERIRRNGSKFTVPFYVKKVDKNTYDITYSLNKALNIPNEEGAKDVKNDIEGNCAVREVMTKS